METLGGCRPFHLSEDLWQEAADLAKRYRSWAWTWGRCPRFVQEAALCRDGQSTRVRLSVEKGTVARAVPADRPPRSVSDLVDRRYDRLIESLSCHLKRSAVF